MPFTANINPNTHSTNPGSRRIREPFSSSKAKSRKGLKFSLLRTYLHLFALEAEKPAGQDVPSVLQ